MKKVTAVFTGMFIQVNKTTGQPEAKYNYVVVSGDVKEYVADKTAEGFYSEATQDARNPIPAELVGKPRFSSPTNLGTECEMERIERKDGTTGWFSDRMEQLIINAEVKSLPDFAKNAYGVALAQDALNRAKATAQLIKANKAKQALAINKDITTS